MCFPFFKTILPLNKMSLQLGRYYRLGRKLGYGAFGEIYEAVNTVTGEKVAVKLELVTAEYPQLAYEKRIYERMVNTRGIPRAHYFGTEGDYNVLVMDLLGKNLEDTFNKCGRRFSLQTTLLLTDQMLSIVEAVHDEGFIHRDLKPDNFLMGNATDPQSVYLVDFGLSKCFWNPETDEHIPSRSGKHLTGTPRYASIKNHQGFEQGRRDDLETLGYIFIYFLAGGLPWQDIQTSSKRARYNEILKMKRTMLRDGSLFEGLPDEFRLYFRHVTGLEFQERPDYDYLKSLFRTLYQKQNYQTHVFDWDRTQAPQNATVRRRPQSSRRPSTRLSSERARRAERMYNSPQPSPSGTEPSPEVRGGRAKRRTSNRSSHVPRPLVV